MTDFAVDLSRLQFALTAMYHFIFVPLTLGMTFILAIMESVYVMSRLLHLQLPMEKSWDGCEAWFFAQH